MATITLHPNWWIECFTLLTPYPTGITQVKIARWQLLSHSWQSLATNGNWEGCVSQIGNVTFAFRNVHICTSTLQICQKSMMEQLTCIYLLPCPIQGNIQENISRKCKWATQMRISTALSYGASHSDSCAYMSESTEQQACITTSAEISRCSRRGFILYCLGECVTWVHPV